MPFAEEPAKEEEEDEEEKLKITVIYKRKSPQWGGTNPIHSTLSQIHLASSKQAQQFSVSKVSQSYQIVSVTRNE